METDGLVEPRWEPGSGGPGRKVYRLTGAGRAWLGEQIETWRRFTAAMDGLLGQECEVRP